MNYKGKDAYEPATFMQLKTLYDLIEKVSVDDLDWLIKSIDSPDGETEFDFWIGNQMRIRELNGTLEYHIMQGVLW